MRATVTELGMIKSRKLTGLQGKNQRRMSKAIKRCQAMGLMPYTYRMKFEETFKPKLRRNV